MENVMIVDMPGFYRVIALKPFRKTEGVAFDIVPMEYLPAIHGIDRVVHQRGAVSPGAVAWPRGVFHPSPREKRARFCSISRCATPGVT